VIVGSLLLIVVAVGLLVAGVLQGANALLIASIVASLLAAVALIVGGRQAAAARAAARGGPRTRTAGSSARLEEPADVTESRTSRRALEREPVGAGVGGSTYGGGYGGRTSDETSMMEPVRDEPYPPSIPQQPDAPGYPHYDSQYDAHDAQFEADDDDDDYDDEPEDEPAPQPTSPGDAARIASMTTDVYVVDGRPRYHLRGCIHLMGRESESLPVGEAVELGFSPCGVCEPDSSILAAARRV